MKNYFLFLFCLTFLAGSCKNKDVQNKEIFQTSDTFDIQRRCEPVSRVIELPKPTSKEKMTWGNAPDFSLPLINGDKLTLSDYAGKVIILDFWATWCPPCMAEIPDFIELYKEYKDKGLMIIGVSLDDTVDPVIKFANSYNMNYPVVMGNSKVIRDYGGIRGIPTTFIIDRKGNIKEKFIGYRPKDVFEKAIKSLLSEKTY